MTAILSDELRSRLSDFVTERLGIRFAPDRWDDLERGVVAAATELGLLDIPGWVEQLLEGVVTFTQQQTLANQLTVGETYFFRQTDVFAALETKVLPELILARRAKRELRIWSAGCSTGEEPYSLAILLHQLLPNFAGWKIVIAGTDVSTQSLNKAAKGLYTEWSFRQTPAWVKERYFTPRGPRHFEVLPKIRDSVRFSYLNLVEASYPSFLGGVAAFDLILCRNVLMYFSAEWQNNILRRLGQQLAPDGYILLGPCDVPSVLGQEFAPAVLGSAFYRKNLQSSEGVPPSIPAWFQPPARSVTILPPIPETFPPPFLATAPAVEADSDLAKNLPAPADILPATLFEKAQSLANQGHLDEALDCCTQAITADPLDPTPRYLRGCIFQELTLFAKAAAEYRSVLYLAPDHIMAHLALAAIAREKHRWSLARRHYRQASRALGALKRGEIVAQSDGLTAGRIQEMITQLTSGAHG